MTVLCTNPKHDHGAYDLNGDPIEGKSAACGHCGLPLHYDSAVENHQHDDPAAPDCFLVHRSAGATPCTAPIGIEAVCGTCGETFNPADGNDTEHIERADGTPCDGEGTISRWWV